MKKVSKIIAVVLAVVMLLSLVGCSKYDAVNGALTKDGYALDENSVLAAILNTIVDASKSYYEEKDMEVPFKAYTYTKGKLLDFEVGIVLEFNNAKQLKEFYDDQSETFKGVVKDVSETNVINGNCLLLSTSSKMYEVFKKA